MNLYDIDNSRSYATEQTLLAVIEKQGFKPNHFVVRNRAGRYTAIFHVLGDQMHEGLRIARFGFKVVG